MSTVCERETELPLTKHLPIPSDAMWYRGRSGASGPGEMVPIVVFHALGATSPATGAPL